MYPRRLWREKNREVNGNVVCSVEVAFLRCVGLDIVTYGKAFSFLFVICKKTLQAKCGGRKRVKL